MLRSGVTRVGVTRGGNWGCHRYFSRRPFLVITVCLSVSSSVSSLLIFSWKHDFFLLITVTFIDFTRVSPSRRVSPRTLFNVLDLVCPLFFVNSPTKKIYFGCHPPGLFHFSDKKRASASWIIMNILAIFLRQTCPESFQYDVVGSESCHYAEITQNNGHCAI